MFGELTLLAILQGAALLSAGAAAGYFLAVQRFDKQRDKLRDELEDARSALKEHHEQVDNHFLKTGFLFNRLTDSYREIYEHLATGAQNLCSTEVTKLQLDQPETRVLPSAGAESAENEPTGDAALTAEADSPETTVPKTNVPEDISDEVKAEAANAAEDSSGAAPSDTLEKEPMAADTKPGDDFSAVKKESSGNTSDTIEKPTATDIAAVNEKTADDEHIGADAAPAPTLVQEETATANPPPGKENAANIDQHKSPPSIH